MDGKNCKNEILLLLHVGEDLDPRSKIRDKLHYKSINSPSLFEWPKTDEPTDVSESEPTEIVRYTISSFLTVFFLTATKYVVPLGLSSF